MSAHMHKQHTGPSGLQLRPVNRDTVKLLQGCEPRNTRPKWHLDKLRCIVLIKVNVKFKVTTFTFLIVCESSVHLIKKMFVFAVFSQESINIFCMQMTFIFHLASPLFVNIWSVGGYSPLKFTSLVEAMLYQHIKICLVLPTHRTHILNTLLLIHKTH